MTFVSGIADDFGNVTDGLSPVTVDGSEVNAALRRAIDVREAKQSGGKYTTSDVAFHIDASELENPPVIGTTITDSDGEWTILSIALQTFGHRYRCICRQLYIDPSNTVNIQIASYAKSDTGALEPTWTTESSSVVAAVQYTQQHVAVEKDARHAPKTAKVYFTTNQNLTAQHRIIAPGGAILTVVTWNNFDDIAQYFTATCVESRLVV